MTKREVRRKYPSAEDDLEEWNPPCLYCDSIKKPCFVRKDRRDRDSSGNVRCEKCMIGRKTVQQCAPGREVYDDDGNVSYGNFPPVPLVKKRSRIDSVGGEESKRPTRKTRGKEADDDQGTILPHEMLMPLIYVSRRREGRFHRDGRRGGTGLRWCC